MLSGLAMIGFLNKRQQPARIPNEFSMTRLARESLYYGEKNMTVIFLLNVISAVIENPLTLWHFPSEFSWVRLHKKGFKGKASFSRNTCGRYLCE